MGCPVASALSYWWAEFDWSRPSSGTHEIGGLCGMPQARNRIERRIRLAQIAYRSPRTDSAGRIGSLPPGVADQICEVPAKPRGFEILASVELCG